MTVFQKYRFDALFLLLIILVATLGIVYRLGVTPPAAYPWSDESDVASDAVPSLEEGLEFHYPAQLAGGPVAVWLQTGWMALFGKSLTGLRVLNGLINLVSILLLYLIVRILPFEHHWPESGPTFNQWLGLTATLFMGGSTWILGLARIATPNWSLVPPVTTLTFYFLWMSLKTNRLRYFIATGVGMGWAIYNYIPAYFVPFVPAIFLGLMWLWRDKKLLPHQPSRLYLVPFPVLLIVALPILIFFALHPVAVMQRVVQLVHTNEVMNTRLMLVGVFDTLSSVGILPNWILQGRFEYVAFDPFLAVLFVAGLVIAIRRRRNPVYLFMLIWWVVMILPAFLSRSASLGFIFEMWRRGIGAQPVSFVFAALTVLTVAEWLFKKIQQSQRQSATMQTTILPAFVAVSVVVSVGSSYWLYFERWANSGVVPLFFAAGPVRMVEWMETESGSDTLFIFPKRTNVSPTVRPELFTVRYMFDGEATTAFPWMDETTLDREVTQLLEEHRPQFVRLMLHNRILVDPKEYFDYALGWRGEVVSREDQPDYNVTTYHLYDDLLRQPVDEAKRGNWFHAVNVDFGDSLSLVGQRIQPDTLLAGRRLGVALRWQASKKIDADFNAGLVLYNSQGDEVVRADKPLLSPQKYLMTSHWETGDESTIYYTLPVPPETPPGRYTLSVVAYDVATGNRLQPAGGQADLSYPLVAVQIWPGFSAVDPSKLAIAQPMQVEPVDGLKLLGVETADTGHNPGDYLKVTTLWQASQLLNRNMGLVLELVGADNLSIPLQAEAQPLIIDHPTTDWPEGAIYRTSHTVLLPATLAGETYNVLLKLVDLETDKSIAEQELFPLVVEGRAHIFEAVPLTTQVDAEFGDAIRLNSFKLAEGLSLQLKLQWQALDQISESYKIFVHLTDPSGQIVSQADVLPQQGAAPTTGWVTGEIIEDEVTLTTPDDFGFDSYRLIVGLYNEATGERLPVGQSDHLVLIEK